MLELKIKNLHAGDSVIVPGEEVKDDKVAPLGNLEEEV